jgi:hypothetical protein
MLDAHHPRTAARMLGRPDDHKIIGSRGYKIPLSAAEIFGERNDPSRSNPKTLTRRSLEGVKVISFTARLQMRRS